MILVIHGRNMIKDLKLPKNYKIMMHPTIAEKMGDKINVIPKKRLIISEWNPIDSITILDMDAIKIQTYILPQFPKCDPEPPAINPFHTR